MSKILQCLTVPLFLGQSCPCIASLSEDSKEAIVFTTPRTPDHDIDLVDERESRFSCTQVLGFSQSLEWYGGVSLANAMAGGGLPELEAGVFLPTWQGSFYVGASIEEWMEPEFPAWAAGQDTTHEAAAHCSRNEVERVVFNVSGAARSAEQWANAIQSVAALIQENFPAVRKIVMQPTVGAPKGECQEVRAARNHPEITKGIRRAAARNGITAGPNPTVASCNQFRDNLGHLTREGAEHVRKSLMSHYRDLTPRDGESEQALSGSWP